MGFGEGFSIWTIVALGYGIPIGVVIWVLVNVWRIRRQLDQIQARLDALTARLDVRR
jgi:hypothetical protein